MYLISCIPPSDEASYKIALQLLIEKYGDKLNDYIKNNYLNGDPLKLGGHMCGRPCEVASGQGMEKTGGNIKMLRAFDCSCGYAVSSTGVLEGLQNFSVFIDLNNAAIRLGL